jgi:hypothetical protein
MPANHVLLQRTTLTADASSVTLNSIPQTGYTDLKLVMSARTSIAGASGDYLRVSFNGNTTGYSAKLIIGNGSSVSSVTTSTERWFAQVGSNGQTANTFGNAEIYIPNYTAAVNKSFSSDSVAETNATTTESILAAGLWSNTAAITSIALTSGNSGNFMAGSSFSLYGIANPSAVPLAAPKADGGDIIKTDGTYWYHAFLSTGAFKPQLSMNADVLVVAGGGGGGSYAGGGGGAGGYLTFTSQALSSASSYTCTVGAGGTAGAGGGGAGFPGGQGGNSQFGALTVALGGGYGGGNQTGGIIGANGGSGGGSGAQTTGTTAGGLGTSGQGNNGGYGNTDNTTFRYGGAGGGASAVGGNAATASSAIGGAGSTTAISGGATTGLGQLSSGSYYFAGGGGGGATQVHAGGVGGGGSSGAYNGAAAVAGTPNTGGGGGGHDYNSPGGAGGSGIIIIRYPV